MATHKVFNQVHPLQDFNLFDIDIPLREMLTRNQAEWAEEDVRSYGRLLGSKEWIEKGFLANKHHPEFHSHNRTGHRIDFVEYHPAYHDIMQAATRAQVHSLPWRIPRKGSQFARLALSYMHTQNEAGSSCPLTMTFSCVPAIKNHFPNPEEWLSKITCPDYDGRDIPYYEKTALTIGMAMTEKQGGTDVRANKTYAKPLGENGPGQPYAITGHKWFCSAPMSDAFLVLAYTDRGLSCFLLPRWTPEGKKNGFHIQRLKDKLGNRSNGSSEVEFNGAFAWLVGEEGRGVPTIIEMVAMTRYDCMIGSSGLMRRGVTEMMHHISHRSVMGKTLIDQPLMRYVAADLCMESEAALAMTERAAHCLENMTDGQEQLLLRLLMPIGKYWITKRATHLLAEAMECHGGNGYVEQSILPRLLREAPVNAIWEGSGNVQCLDVIRAIRKSPAALGAFLDELQTAFGLHPMYDKNLNRLKSDLRGKDISESMARYYTERLALAFQAAQLLKIESPVAETFCLARLNKNAGQMFGALPEGINVDQVLKRYQSTSMTS